MSQGHLHPLRPARQLQGCLTAHHWQLVATSPAGCVQLVIEIRIIECLREGGREGGREGDGDSERGKRVRGGVSEEGDVYSCTHCFFLQMQAQFNSNTTRYRVFNPFPSDGIPHLLRVTGDNIAQWYDQSAKEVILINFVMVPDFNQ